MTNKQPLSSSTIKPPLFPKRMMTRGLPDATLNDHEQYSQLTLSQDLLIGQIADYLTFEQVQCKGVNMNSTTFTHLQLGDVRLTECDLANARWPEAGLHRVEASECRMTGFVAIEAKFQDVLFKQCKINLAQFRFSTFKAVRFEDCDLSDADFQGADLTGVSFVRCNLQNVEMSGAKLIGADLRSSTIDGLRAGPRELQGAIVDSAQALVLVQAFGIVVKSSLLDKS
jgi:uncharacterized protein YjbI with pentapeptide repeats